MNTDPDTKGGAEEDLGSRPVSGISETEEVDPWLFTRESETQQQIREEGGALSISGIRPELGSVLGPVRGLTSSDSLEGLSRSHTQSSPDGVEVKAAIEVRRRESGSPEILSNEKAADNEHIGEAGLEKEDESEAASQDEPLGESKKRVTFDVRDRYDNAVEDQTRVSFSIDSWDPDESSAVAYDKTGAQQLFQKPDDLNVLEEASIPLPGSDASSVVSELEFIIESGLPLPLGYSLEDLRIPRTKKGLEHTSELEHPDDLSETPENPYNQRIETPVPESDQESIEPLRRRTSSWKKWVIPSLKPRRRPTRSVSPLPKTWIPRTLLRSVEVDEYRAKVNELATRFTTFRNVAARDTRLEKISRIVYYDSLDGRRHLSPIRREVWEHRRPEPSYRLFRGEMRDVCDDCFQRLILIEDLTPILIDLLGATFQIPPHVFEDHLDKSGYSRSMEAQKMDGAWHTRSTAQGYSSVTWYRPVLPLIPVSKIREELLNGREPRIHCPIEDCKSHDVWLGTAANIWRHQLDLCPNPGVYFKDSQTEHPVGWEERATTWTHDFDGCKFIIVLLDPLPVVVLGDGKREILVDGESRREAVLPLRWYRQQELDARERKRQSSRSHSHRQHVNRRMEDTTLPHRLANHRYLPAPTPDAPHRLVPQSPTTLDTVPVPSSLLPRTSPFLPRQSHTVENAPVANPVLPLRTSGADIDNYWVDTDPAVRRRSMKPNMDRFSTTIYENHPVPSTEMPRLEHYDRRGSMKLSPSMPSPYRPSLEFEVSGQRSRDDGLHSPLITFEPIRARSSSAVWNQDTFDSRYVRAYIGTLRHPKSTLDEFDYFLTLPRRRKYMEYDPFHALFRAIHDDSNSLVEIIRTSLRTIRKDTLNEDLMQTRVKFWRGLMHQLNFSLDVLEQSLRDFEHFVIESEVFVESPSRKLARDTRQSLRSCINLIDRCSQSLLAEMQIADSGRSIVEAESVSKLTELAFVFVPLSFVASLFSMQVHELDGGVPLYSFALVAIGFVIVAYAVRLSIRSSRLVQYKTDTMNRIRDDSRLQHNDSVPTHIFLAWVGNAINDMITKSLSSIVAIVAPSLVVLAVLAAIISPIVLMWQRNIDPGFLIAITVLMLLLDVILIVPVAIDLSRAGYLKFDTRDRLRSIQWNHEMNRKQREKAKRRKRRRAGSDPEAPTNDSMESSIFQGAVHESLFR